MKNGTLYRLDFKSGKSYIGITAKSAEQRFAEHEIAARNGSQYLVHKAWRKYGAPVLVIVSSVESSLLLKAECAAVAKFSTLQPLGYNMTPGGEISPGSVPEIAEKISNSMKGIKRSDEFVSRLRERQFTDAWREKLSVWQRGRKLSKETRTKMSIAQAERQKRLRLEKLTQFQLVENNR